MSFVRCGLSIWEDLGSLVCASYSYRTGLIPLPRGPSHVG